MDEIIKGFLHDSANAKQTMASDPVAVDAIRDAATQLIRTVDAGGTIYMCGNGGSACDSMHFCEELVARYKRHRNGIRAQHLLDPAVLTCRGNDYDFESVFSRQVETLCNPLDTLVVFSTSGKSKNIIQAAKTARRVGCAVIGLTGRTGGNLAAEVDVCIKVPADTSDRIQESHITIVHILCEVLETAEYFERFSSFSPKN